MKYVGCQSYKTDNHSSGRLRQLQSATTIQTELSEEVVKTGQNIAYYF